IGFDLPDAASIAIIGAADGPTSIYVSQYFNSAYQGAIMVAAYSYMALVPIIQPPVIKLCTTKKERRIRMEYHPAEVSQATRILFPIIVTIIAGAIAPKSAELIGFLMFGNLIRECGVLKGLSETAQNVLANLVTLLLGLSVAYRMQADAFINLQTLAIIGLGLVAFIFDTAGGVFFAKFINLFLPKNKKVNPMIGAAGISAFPMSSRVIHKMGRDEDPFNYLLMHAAGANVSGQIASVIAGGLLISLVQPLIGG
ncbi:MAG: sodium ion-translocating decarboxylase subunit beta, partial [Eubacteriales bacterium]|nr:sodium ion-translocating decarboxylase subunit beta [Eubacteriales bacterium]